VFTSVQVYNANTNNFLSTTLIVEFNRGGGLVPSIAFRSFPADLYLTEEDQSRRILEYVVFSCIIALVRLFVFSGERGVFQNEFELTRGRFQDVMMIIDFVRYAKKKKSFFPMGWFFDPMWNFIGLVNYVCCACIVFRF
jgi:hypothetical protein